MKKRLIIALVQIGSILILLLITIRFTGERNRNRTEEEKSFSSMPIEDMAESGELLADGNVEEKVFDPENEDSERETMRPDSTAGADSTTRPKTSTTLDASPVPLYQNVEFETESQLGEIMYYWADNNMRALNELAFLEHNKAMSYSLTGTDDYYYYGDADVYGVPNGQGVAVYADNRYYYGSWKDGKRDGEGTFLHYHIHEVQVNKDVYSYHFYAGSWAGDLPNGAGSEHYAYNMHNLTEGVGYNSNLIGSYQDGLYHGDFYITNIYSDNNTKEWDASAIEGAFQYFSDNKDKLGRRTVQIDRADDDNYIWMHPYANKNLGVKCLNVSGKRRLEPLE